MAFIEAQQVRFSYEPESVDAREVLHGVDLSIEEGEFVALLGHNGCGKSTMAKLFIGLLRPTGGQVLLDGKNIWAEPKKIRSVRFRVGMVFQYPEYQLFEETVLKDIMFGPKNMGLSDQEAESRAREAAHFTGLKEELLGKSPFELSGGEKRRAAIAGVIAMDPDVLILDEPTAGLDPRGRDVLLAQITQYHKNRGNTVLLVSHSMEDIGRTADRILVMNGGRAAMLDETKKVFERGPQLEAMGLRVPQITKIMQELQKLGLPVDPSTLTVDSALQQLIPILKRKEELR